MEDIIVYFIACIIQMLVFLLYTREMLGLKRKLRWFVISWMATTLTDDLIVRITGNKIVLINAALYLLCMEITAFIACKGSWKKKLFIVLAFDIFVIALETVIVNSISLFTGRNIDELMSNQMISNIVIMVTQMLAAFMAMLVTYIWKRQKEYDVSILQWLGILLVSLGCFASICILGTKALHEDEVSMGYIAVCVILVFINFISYYYYIILAKKNKMEFQAKLQAKQLSMYEGWYEEIKNVRKENMSFRHDMKNHFSVMRKICEDESETPDKNIRKLQDYLDSLGIEYMSFGVGEESGNMAIDAVVGIKKSYALSKGIRFDAGVHIPKDMKCDSMDMVIILGNLLDNAIEACEKTEDNKEIKLVINYSLRNLFITIENTYNGRLDNTKKTGDRLELPKTTKSDFIHHGIGLQNVKNVVKKYNGEMSWTAKDNVFKVEILMYQLEENIKKDELLQKSN